MHRFAALVGPALSPAIQFDSVACYMGWIRLLIVEARDGHERADDFCLRQRSLSYLFARIGWEERFAESTSRRLGLSRRENLQTLFV
jgi:hypothetical protein